jgi:hypothetical protein
LSVRMPFVALVLEEGLKRRGGDPVDVNCHLPVASSTYVSPGGAEGGR